MQKNYYPKSYNEEWIIYPDESGRNCLSTIGKDSLSSAWNLYYNNDEPEEHIPRNEIESIFWETAYNTEQRIIDTIDFSFWDRNISPELLDILEYENFIEEYWEQTGLEK